MLSETSFLLADLPQAVAKVGNWLQRGILILSPIGAAAQTAVFELMQKYRKVPMSYADACMACLAGAHAGSRVFTVDSDFQIYRFERNRPIPLTSPFWHSPGVSFVKIRTPTPIFRSCKPSATPRTPPTTDSSSIRTPHFTAKKASWICASKAAKTAAAPCSGNRCGIW